MKRQGKSQGKRAVAEQTPRCRFCGRRNTVRRLDSRQLYCDHCQQMFQVE